MGGEREAARNRHCDSQSNSWPARRSSQLTRPEDSWSPAAAPATILNSRAMIGVTVGVRRSREAPVRRGIRSPAVRVVRLRGVIVGLANIGAREIRKRRTLGIVSAVAAGLLGFVLIGYEAPRWTRLLLFLPLWLAGLGVFQAREKT